MSKMIFDVWAGDDGVTFTVENPLKRTQKKSSKGVVVRYDGPEGEGMVVHEGERFNGITGTAADRLFVVGDKGRVHTNGSGSWQAKKMVGAKLSAIREQDDVLFAVGENGTIAWGTFEGGFESVNVTDALFTAIGGRDASSMIAVGDDKLVARSPEGFEEVSMPRRARYLGVLPLSDTILVTADGGLFRGDPRSGFERVETPVKRLYSAAVFQDQIYVAAGSDGIHRLQGDTLVPVCANTAAYNISVGDSHLCAVGMSFRATFDGHRWTVSTG